MVHCETGWMLQVLIYKPFSHICDTSACTCLPTLSSHLRSLCPLHFRNCRHGVSPGIRRVSCAPSLYQRTVSQRTCRAVHCVGLPCMGRDPFRCHANAPPGRTQRISILVAFLWTFIRLFPRLRRVVSSCQVSPVKDAGSLSTHRSQDLLREH
jgi:hypothetical protein